MMFNSYVRLALWCVLFGCWSPFAAQAADAEPTVAFLSGPDAQKVLTGRDDFISRLSVFDRSMLARDGVDVSQDRYLKLLRQTVLDWTPAERGQIETIWADLDRKLGGMQRYFPASIAFIKTRGSEEAGSEYTRGNAIILPQSAFASAGDAPLDQIIAHELFHILSRDNPLLRQKLYSAIGFLPCGEIPFPIELAGRKMTNPDEPINDQCIRLQTGSGPVWAVPLDIARKDRYDASKADTFADYIQLKFLVVQWGGPSSTENARYDVEHPVLLDVGQVGGFYEQVGRNTNYIDQPDEILAENFRLLLFPTASVASPEIMRRIAALLTP